MMRRAGIGLVVWCVVGTMCLAWGRVQAEVTNPSPKTLLELTGQDNQPLTITAKQAEFDNKRHLGTYTGEVVVKRGEATLYAEKMVVQLDSQTNRIIEITAQGQVRMVQKNREITAQKATYYATEQKLVLTGEPKSRQDENIVQGSRMIYFMNEDRIVVEDARSVFYPSAGTAKLGPGFPE